MPDELDLNIERACASLRLPRRWPILRRDVATIIAEVINDVREPRFRTVELLDSLIRLGYLVENRYTGLMTAGKKLGAQVVGEKTGPPVVFHVDTTPQVAPQPTKERLQSTQRFSGQMIDKRFLSDPRIAAAVRITAAAWNLDERLITDGNDGRPNNLAFRARRSLIHVLYDRGYSAPFLGQLFDMTPSTVQSVHADVASRLGLERSLAVRVSRMFDDLKKEEGREGESKK